MHPIYCFGRGNKRQGKRRLWRSCLGRASRTPTQSHFQALLLPQAPLAVSEERSLNFKTMGYEPGWFYEGGFQLAAS
jgi:hypothetical protein